MNQLKRVLKKEFYMRKIPFISLILISSTLLAKSFNISDTVTDPQTLDGDQTGVINSTGAIVVSGDSSVTITDNNNSLSNSGNITCTSQVASSAVFISGSSTGNTITNNVGGIISNLGDSALGTNIAVFITDEASNTTITNNGTVSTTGTCGGPQGLIVSLGSSATITNNGTATLNATNGEIITGIGLDNPSANCSIINSGEIILRGTNTTDDRFIRGIDIPNNSNHTLSNTGTITIATNSSNENITVATSGIFYTANASLECVNEGTINMFAITGADGGAARGMVISGGDSGATIRNNGTINVAASNNSNQSSSAMAALSNQARNINNGTISAEGSSIDGIFGMETSQPGSTTINNGEISINGFGTRNVRGITHANAGQTDINNGTIRITMPGSTADRTAGIYLLATSNENQPNMVINNGNIFAGDGFAINGAGSDTETLGHTRVVTHSNKFIEGRIKFGNGNGNSFTVIDENDTNSYFAVSGSANLVYSGNEAHIINGNEMVIIGSSNLLASVYVPSQISNEIDAMLSARTLSRRCPKMPDNSVWFYPFYSSQLRPPKNDRYSSKTRLAGGTVGYDHNFGTEVILGGFVSGFAGDTKINSYPQKDKYFPTGTTFGAYFNYLPKYVNVNAQLGFGYVHQNTIRHVFNNLASGGIQPIYGDFGSYFVTPEVGIGAPINFWKFKITPNIDVRYIYQHQDSYTEDGNSPAKQKVHDRNLNELITKGEIQFQNRYISTILARSRVGAEYDRYWGLSKATVSALSQTVDVQLNGNTYYWSMYGGLYLDYFIKSLKLHLVADGEVRKIFEPSTKDGFGISSYFGVLYEF